MPRSRGWPPRPAARAASRSRSATCSRRAARRAAGCSSSTRSSGRRATRPTPPVPVERVYRCTVCRDQRGGSALRHGAARPGRRRAGRRRRRRRGRPGMGRRPLSRRRRRPGPGRRAHRPAHRPPARVARGDHRADRGRPAGGTGRSPRSAWPSCTRSSRPAGWSAPAADRWPCASPAATSGPPTRRALPRAQPVARLRGGLPARPRLRPAARGSNGPVQARLGDDLRSLGEGTASAVLAVASPSAIRPCGTGRSSTAGSATGPRVRLVLGQPAIRPGLERLASGVPRHGLGARAARPPRCCPSTRSRSRRCALPWSWHAVAIGRALAAVEPSIARDGRVVQLVDGGPEAVAAAAIGRRIGRLSRGRRPPRRARRRPDRASSSSCRPARPCRRGPRTRANVGLDPVPGGAGDPDLVPGPGLFAPPERFDQRPFSAAEAARVVTDVGGRDAQGPRRAGPLRAPVRRDPRRPRPVRASCGGWRPAGGRPATTPPMSRAASGDTSLPDPSDFRTRPGDRRVAGAAGARRRSRTRRRRGGRGARRARPTASRATRSSGCWPSSATSSAGPSQHRLVEIEPGRWWLAERADRDAAAPPLADRVEWAVFSLLSTAGPITEHAFFERIADDVHRPRPARRGARPGLPRELPQPGQHARPARDAATTCCAAARSTPSSSGCSPTAAIGSGMRVWIGRARAGPARSATGRLLGDLPRRPRARGLPRRHQPGGRRRSPRSMPSGTSAARSRSCSRSSGRRSSATRCCAATCASATTSGSSASSSSPRSGPTSCATSWSGRRSCARRWTTAAGTS